MNREEILEKLDLKDMRKKENKILDFCEIYNQTEFGLNEIRAEWIQNKINTSTWGDLSIMEILSRHPNYVANKGYIVISEDYERPIDKNVIYNVISNLMYDNGAADSILEEYKLNNFSFKEIDRIYGSLCRRYSEVYSVSQFKNSSYTKLLLEDRDRFSNYITKYYDVTDDIAVRYNDNFYTKESYRKYLSYKRIMQDIYDFCVYHDIGDDLPDAIMQKIEEQNIKGIRKNQNLTKIVGKICRYYGVDKTILNYNQHMARLGDAASPKTFKRHTIVSANPIDYYTMSWGDSWCSCANIDKEHKRYSSRNGMYGDGCCSSGTISYMLDPSTVVMYTVSEGYDGKDFELQDKINRCLFHVGDKKFVMGRIYPQGEDGADAVYKQWREKFQKVLADCLSVTNYWKTQSEDKYYQYENHGTHYRDYEQDYCNIAKWSWLKENQDSTRSPRLIQIGHNPICICCGEEHDIESNIQCDACGNERIECEHCGSLEFEQDMYYIDGRYYCPSCVTYCNYHNEYEVSENVYPVVNMYNVYVCDEAVEYGNYYYYGSDIYEYDEDTIETDDGNTYPDGETAEIYGYRYVESENEWLHKDDVTYCEECGKYVRNEDYNIEENRCNNCC